jgi:hypothetical protein
MSEGSTRDYCQTDPYDDGTLPALSPDGGAVAKVAKTVLTSSGGSRRPGGVDPGRSGGGVSYTPSWSRSGTTAAPEQQHLAHMMGTQGRLQLVHRSGPWTQRS